LDIDTRSAARQDEHVMGGHVVALVIIVGLPAMATAREHAPCPPTVHRALPLRVVDGDTFRLHGERIRILGIDTPERGEPGSGRATYRLLALLRSGNVVIVRHGKDVYCRTLADVYVDGWNVAGCCEPRVMRSHCLWHGALGAPRDHATQLLPGHLPGRSGGTVP